MRFRLLSQLVALTVFPCSGCHIVLVLGSVSLLWRMGFLSHRYVRKRHFSSGLWRLRSRLFCALTCFLLSDSVGSESLWGISWKPLPPDQLPLTWLDLDLTLCPQHWVAVGVPLASCCVLQNLTRARRTSPGWRAVSALAVSPSLWGPPSSLPLQSRAASRRLARRLPSSQVVPVHFELLWLLPRAIEQV